MIINLSITLHDDATQIDVMNALTAASDEALGLMATRNVPLEVDESWTFMADGCGSVNLFRSE